MQSERVIKRPLVLTEKGTRLREECNQYMFEVDPTANKIQIRDAVRELFNVQVRHVRTMLVRGRLRRMGRGYAKTRNWKKAIVTLREGESIDLFEGG